MLPKLTKKLQKNYKNKSTWKENPKELNSS